MGFHGRAAASKPYLTKCNLKFFFAKKSLHSL